MAIYVHVVTGVNDSDICMYMTDKIKSFHISLATMSFN